jgi:hypothetical protein
MGADMSDAMTNDWAETLRTFNERNVSREMDLEIITSELGAQSEVRGMKLNGVTYDHHDGGVEIMLGAGRLGHITHAIGGVTSIDMLKADAPSNDVLRISYDGGQSILTMATRRSARQCGVGTGA